MSETPTDSSEVRLSGSLIRERALGAVTLKAAEPTEPTMVLRGAAIREQGIKERFAYLRSIQNLAGKWGWSRLLSGENPDVSSGGVRLHEKRCIEKAGAEIDKSVVGFGVVRTGADYKGLASKNPTKHYKFYHSFRDEQLGETYVAEVIKKAVEQGLSVSLKSFDHDYDGMNIYTYHFQQMEAIIREVYPRYREAFYDAEHFLQGGIEDINPKHIGWVQEPVAAARGRSHSGRMSIVGKILDNQGLSELAYDTGCREAGVRPDMPWLLTDEYDRELRERATPLQR